MNKSYNIIDKIKKSSSPEPLGQFQPNLAQLTKHPWVKGIQDCSNEGPHRFPKGENEGPQKYIEEILISSSPEPLGQFQPIWAKSILG